jgi:hypothetical protein
MAINSNTELLIRVIEKIGSNVQGTDVIREDISSALESSIGAVADENTSISGGGGTELLDEGNGEGLVILGRTAANFGPVGLNAVDLTSQTFADEASGATGARSFAVGGDNDATGIESVSLGNNNSAAGLNSTIGGGKNSTIDAAGNKSVIAGGYSHTINGAYGFIGGGYSNSINPSMSDSGIMGGRYNIVNHATTFIAGAYITTNRTNSFFCNNLSITSIPTSAAGLPSGAVWSNAGVLTIVT